MAEMHKFLTGFEKYNRQLPFYIEKPFTENQVEQLREVIDANRNRSANYSLVPGDQEMFHGESRFDPKKIVHMSRQLVEFICPPGVEAIMDSYAKPCYDGDIALCHYNYINYSLEHGEGKYAPSLPPHIDADENLVTFNYNLDTNIDWDVIIDGVSYELKKGDAIVFSAVNQVHWRPKRKWLDGEFLEIVSFDYCPTTNYRFTGEDNPIDQFKFAEKRKAYVDGLNEHPSFQKGWEQYHREGKEIGIPETLLGDFA
jgi:hypothetical protein